MRGPQHSKHKTLIRVGLSVGFMLLLYGSVLLCLSLALPASRFVLND